jgi:CMP-N-acetylneuraminic acid synthetase
MMIKDGIGGKQVIKHNLYRRQDYPECFEISHYISIFNKNIIHNLNNNLYNKDTVYFSIDETIDVDTEKDLKNYNEKNKNNR